MALGLTQPLTEMSTGNLPGGVKGGRRIRLATLPPSVSRLSRENVGASTSHSPMDLHGLLQWELYLFFTSRGRWFSTSASTYDSVTCRTGIITEKAWEASNTTSYTAWEVMRIRVELSAKSTLKYNCCMKKAFPCGLGYVQWNIGERYVCIYIYVCMSAFIHYVHKLYIFMYVLPHIKFTLAGVLDWILDLLATLARNS
jgi:hypothetical protein